MILPANPDDRRDLKGIYTGSVRGPNGERLHNKTALLQPSPWPEYPDIVFAQFDDVQTGCGHGWTELALADFTQIR